MRPQVRLWDCYAAETQDRLQMFVVNATTSHHMYLSSSFLPTWLSNQMLFILLPKKTMRFIRCPIGDICNLTRFLFFFKYLKRTILTKIKLKLKFVSRVQRDIKIVTVGDTHRLFQTMHANRITLKLIKENLEKAWNNFQRGGNIITAVEIH